MTNLPTRAVLVVGRRLERGAHWWRAAKLYERALRLGQDPNGEIKFRLGYCRYRSKRSDLALVQLEQAVRAQPDNGVWQHLLGMTLLKQKKFVEASEALEAAVLLMPTKLDWRLHLVTSLVEGKNRNGAIRILEEALVLHPTDNVVLDQLASELKKSQLRWRELEVLLLGIGMNHDEPKWHDRIASASFYLNRFESAAKHYRIARGLSPQNSDYWYYEGLSWLELGDRNNSNISFSKVIELDVKLNANTLSIGAVHQSKGLWRLAADAYYELLQENYFQAEIHYRLGYCNEKLYQWDKSAAAYEQAIAIEPSKSHWHYRLGYVLERAGRFSQAGKTYVWAAKHGKTNQAFRWFQAGHALQSAGDFIGACEAYISSAIDYGFIENPNEGLIEDPHDQDASEYLGGFVAASNSGHRLAGSPAFYENLGDKLNRDARYQEAASAFEAAIFYRKGVKYALYAKQGLALMNAERFEEACDAFSRTRLFARSSGVDERPYIKGPQTRLNMTYNEYRESLQVDDNVILFESSHGSAIHCNPYGIYRRITLDPRFANFRFVWVVNDVAKIPRDVARDGKVTFVHQNDDRYLLHLATAKYLVNNATFPVYFIRREEQTYLNTWHGTPLKLMGNMVFGSHFEHSNVVRNLLQASHLFLPNEHTRQTLVRDHDIDGLVTARIQLGGSPRVDASLNITEERKKDIRKILGLQGNSERQVILYAPTWRGDLGKQVFDTDRLIADLESMSGDQHDLIFRAHRFAENAIRGASLDVNIVPPSIDTNELLSVVDILITDYSSIFFDFLVLDRTTIFYVPDYNEYVASRGLYFEPNSWPGEVCHDRDTLMNAVDRAVDGGTDLGIQNRESFRTIFSAAEDGNSSARAVDFLFDDVSASLDSDAVSERLNVLFYQGTFIPNGITTSFSSLIAALDPEKYRVVVVIDPKQVQRGSHAGEIFSSLPETVQVIARTGFTVQSPEERHISDHFHKFNNFENVEQHQIYRQAMQKEFKRIFGNIHFDFVINFEGYSRFWGSIMANPNNSAAETIVYLHNDMMGERNSRFPRLDAMFEIYDDYDKLVSVSASVLEVNSEKLSNKYGIDSSKFLFANNLIDTFKSTNLASEQIDLDLMHLRDSGTVKFVNMARLSPEKGHEKLLRSFAQVHQLHPSTSLVILGDGPLRHKLERLAFDLGLVEAVTFAGQRSNPFPILATCDCFVFSSEYEGQGLAMIEAMTLGLPVISTDVVGSRSVVEGGYGILVENSVEGLVSGMNAYMEGERPKIPFSARLYQREALRHFEEHVVGRKSEGIAS